MTRPSFWFALGATILVLAVLLAYCGPALVKPEPPPATPALIVLPTLIPAPTLEATPTARIVPERVLVITTRLPTPSMTRIPTSTPTPEPTETPVVPMRQRG